MRFSPGSRARTLAVSPLLRIALEILEDPYSALGVKNVACATILIAIEQGVEVPTGSHMSVWRHLLASDGSVVLHRHELIHEEVGRDALRVLRDRDSGEGACDLAVAVLKDQNVRVISDDDLVTIADRMLDESKVRRLTWLIERIHEERGLTPELIVGLRDRLAVSHEPDVRAGAAEIGALVPRLDEHFAIRLINDPAPPVRTAVADLLEKVDLVDRPRALVIARQRLDVEQHRAVLSALHYCVGSLERQTV